MRRLVLACAAVTVGLLLVPLSAAAATSSARIVNCPPAIACFSPNPIRVTVGDRVTWTNNSSLTHTATSNTGAWDTGTITPGATSGAVAFNTVGTFAYHCAIHPSMTGSVIVSAAPSVGTSPPVRLAPGGEGPRPPIAAGLLLLGLVVLAARGVRRDRTQRLDEGVDKLPHQ